MNSKEGSTFGMIVISFSFIKKKRFNANGGFKGVTGLQPSPPLAEKCYEKRSFLVIFRAANPLSGPNGGQK